MASALSFSSYGAILFCLTFCLLQSHGEAFSCFMCNTLMGDVQSGTYGYASACPKNPEYHAMHCSGSNYCMKLDGIYTVVGSKNTSQAATVTGVQRDCGSPINIQLFYNKTVTGEICEDVVRTNVNRTDNIYTNGNMPVMNFTGKVCFCNHDSCNTATGTTMGIVTLLAAVCSLLMQFN